MNERMLQKCSVCITCDLNVHKHKIIFVILLLFFGSVLFLTFQQLPKSFYTFNFFHVAEDEIKFQSWLESQHQINMNIMQVCDKYTDLKSIIVPSRNIMFDNSSRLLLCRNAKAGSTTWLHHFVNQGSSRIQNFAKTFKETQFHAKVPKLFNVEKLKFTELSMLVNLNTTLKS